MNAAKKLSMYCNSNDDNISINWNPDYMCLQMLNGKHLQVLNGERYSIEPSFSGPNIWFNLSTSSEDNGWSCFLFSDVSKANYQQSAI